MAKKWKRILTDSEVKPYSSAPAPCEPGSIEQQLDMCETGSLRGEEVTQHHGLVKPDHVQIGPRGLDTLVNENYNFDMSEENREGDEMSGDEHSSGLQGGDPDLESQPHVHSGIPGEETKDEEAEELEIQRRLSTQRRIA